MNRRNGKGRFNTNGTTYEGEFMDGLFHGVGKGVWVGGGYDGEWVRGLRSGRGRGYGVGWSYEGEWYAGKMDGYGRMMTDRVEKAGYWENDVYIGEAYEN